MAEQPVYNGPGGHLMRMYYIRYFKKKTILKQTMNFFLDSLFNICLSCITKRI
jgi:hypothetical protein